MRPFFFPRSSLLSCLAGASWKIARWSANDWRATSGRGLVRSVRGTFKNIRERERGHFEKTRRGLRKVGIYINEVATNSPACAISGIKANAHRYYLLWYFNTLYVPSLSITYFNKLIYTIASSQSNFYFITICFTRDWYLIIIYIVLRYFSSLAFIFYLIYMSQASILTQNLSIFI